MYIYICIYACIKYTHTYIYIYIYIISCSVLGCSVHFIFILSSHFYILPFSFMPNNAVILYSALQHTLHDAIKIVLYHNTTMKVHVNSVINVELHIIAITMATTTE